MRGASVPNAQPALQQGSGRLTKFHHQFHCILVERIVFAAFSRSFASARSTSSFPIVFWRLQELLLIFSRALLLPEFDYSRNFFFRNQWRMQAMYRTDPEGR